MKTIHHTERSTKENVNHSTLLPIENYSEDRIYDFSSEDKKLGLLMDKQ